MATYIFAWNPARWPWSDLEDDLAEFRRNRFIEFDWTAGNTKSIKAGARVFLLRQNRQRGLIASGNTISDVFKGPFEGGSKKIVSRVRIRFDQLLPINDVLPLEQIEHLVPEVHWRRIQASGDPGEAKQCGSKTQRLVAKAPRRPQASASAVRDLAQGHGKRIYRTEPFPASARIGGPEVDN
jgi:hypothetical protein